MMNKDSKKPKTKLLSDSPAEVDAFGGHQELADALANLFLTEDGGKSIALSGSFGSGKSTLIRLLRKKLHEEAKKGDNKKEYKIFTYDAWKHQNDPLRRSFIEELHNFLKLNNWIGSQYDSEIEILQKKREEAENTVESSLTTPGKIAALGTFLAPILLKSRSIKM